MKIVRVKDSSYDEIKLERFNLTIFSSGHEERCVDLLQLLRRERLGSVHVLEFDVTGDSELREQHNKVFQKAGGEICVLPRDDETKLFDLLRSIDLPDGGRVLIDYSSMPRTWVNSVINFFKFSRHLRKLDLYFSYTVGNHVDAESFPDYPVSDYRVTSIECLSTLEGAAVRQRKTTAFVGLGFDWVSPFAVLETVEPDEVICFHANPGAFPHYGLIALQKNKQFLDEYAKEKVISLPLRSVETVYRSLGEWISPIRSTRNVLLVPLGPKPHILGAILLANTFQDLTCLRIKGGRNQPLRVKAAAFADVVVTRVELMEPPQAS